MPILREWSADDTPRKLAVTLDHEYTKGGLTWDALKGVDRAKARILGEAARQAGCHASLALLTLWQSGAAEGEYVGGYGRRGRWYSDYANEDEDAGDHEMGEIYDTSLTAKDWRDTEDHDLPIGELNVEDEEILDLESLTDVKPEEEFEGYTGNAGMTLDRWYRHAAVFLWPERRHFDILCDRDGRNVVPVLNRMVSRWKRSHPKDAALKQQCLDFAAAIMTRWRARDHAPVTDDKTLAADLLTALVALAEPKLIERFFGEVMMKDVTIEPGEAVVEVGEKFGWTTFERELLTVFKSTTRDSMERNVGLLEQLCLAKPRTVEGWRELCRSLARESIGAIVAVKSKVPSDEWRGRTVNRADLLAGLARSLLATDQVDLMEDLVAHALASRSNYPLTSAHVPALSSLLPWLKTNVKRPCPPLSRWVAACREQLESLTARAPREPADYRRAAIVVCTCSICAALNRFLADSGEAVHRLKAKQDLRSHLEQKIREYKCDLDLKTEAKSSPHTLVCTKNTASYQRRLKTFKENQVHLATILSIQSSLPR